MSACMPQTVRKRQKLVYNPFLPTALMSSTTLSTPAYFTLLQDLTFQDFLKCLPLPLKATWYDDHKLTIQCQLILHAKSVSVNICERQLCRALFWHEVVGRIDSANADLCGSKKVHCWDFNAPEDPAPELVVGRGIFVALDVRQAPGVAAVQRQLAPDHLAATACAEHFRIQNCSNSKLFNSQQTEVDPIETCIRNP